MNKNYFAHPTAVIDDGATIGEGTHIWHFSHIMAKATIGSNCNLGQNIFVDNNVTIGKGVKIQNNVSIYNGVVFEDEVFVGPSAVFTNVINPRSAINRKAEFKQTLVKKGASIGANATVICGIVVGQYSFVAAGSVVTKNVPDYGLVKGNPASLCGWVSESGSKLEFDTMGKAVCALSGQSYLLNSKGVTKL